MSTIFDLITTALSANVFQKYWENLYQNMYWGYTLKKESAKDLSTDAFAMFFCLFFFFFFFFSCVCVCFFLFFFFCPFLWNNKNNNNIHNNNNRIYFKRVTHLATTNLYVVSWIALISRCTSNGSPQHNSYTFINKLTESTLCVIWRRRNCLTVR